MRELAYYEAKFEALEEIMAADQRVHLINGTFLSLSPHRHVYQNLKSKYGERMISPPISELGFCGLATGAAMAGLRPIVDLSTGSFIYEAWPQVANEAANAYSMSGGQTRCLWFFTCSTACAAAARRSTRVARNRCSGTFPGWRLRFPLRRGTSKACSRRQCRADNPTIFVDHTRLLDIRGEVPENDKPIPFGVADVKRQGTDVTLIATSYTVQVALQAAAKLAQRTHRSRSRRSAHPRAVRSGNDSYFR